MNSSEPTPRVNGAMLKDLVGKKVRLVGKVISTDGSIVTLEAADGAKVLVNQITGSHYDTAYVEVVGIVDGPDRIVENEYTNFGDNFELKNYNELCVLANSTHAGLFIP